jgi:hypothetical protein
MPLLPFIMMTIAVTSVFFLAGINYVSTDHLVERERIEWLAGEYVAITMGLEAYRAENGAFPTGPDWRSRIEVYSPGRHLPVRDGDDWAYSAAAGGYSLCFSASTGDGNSVLNATFLCPPAGGSGADPEVPAGAGA